LGWLSSIGLVTLIVEGQPYAYRWLGKAIKKLKEDEPQPHPRKKALKAQGH
jgi:hypothetical protein